MGEERKIWRDKKISKQKKRREMEGTLEEKRIAVKEREKNISQERR